MAVINYVDTTHEFYAGIREVYNPVVEVDSDFATNAFQITSQVLLSGSLRYPNYQGESRTTHWQPGNATGLTSRQMEIDNMILPGYGVEGTIVLLLTINQTNGNNIMVGSNNRLTIIVHSVARTPNKPARPRAGRTKGVWAVGGMLVNSSQSPLVPHKTSENPEKPNKRQDAETNRDKPRKT